MRKNLHMIFVVILVGWGLTFAYPGKNWSLFSVAYSQGWKISGEISCSAARGSKRSYWQGQFQSEERDENAFGRVRRSVINEWRCFETRSDCARWLTEMRSNYATYLRAAQCRQVG